MRTRVWIRRSISLWTRRQQRSEPASLLADLPRERPAEPDILRRRACTGRHPERRGVRDTSVLEAGVHRGPNAAAASLAEAIPDACASACPRAARGPLVTPARRTAGGATLETCPRTTVAARVFRGRSVEAEHRATIAVVGRARGAHALVRRPERSFSLRSTTKPLQALPLVTVGRGGRARAR
jgi:hypothetical protein